MRISTSKLRSNAHRTHLYDSASVLVFLPNSIILEKS